jgi:Flp pilus assembly protein TadD
VRIGYDHCRTAWRSAHGEGGRRKEAADVLLRALTHDPDDRGMLAALFVHARQQGDATRALGDARRLAEPAP